MPQTESQARANLINPQLFNAGWNLSDASRVRFEVPVQGYDPAPWNGFTDYCLYDGSGNVLAVVEAKRTARNPREGEEQLRQYVNEIAATQEFPPFGFMTNGLHAYFWEVGLEHPRMIAGFFSPFDLERLNYIRKNRTPLADTPINNSIVDRPYQHEAIRRVGEAFAEGRRRALLVMATGTGKTRTTMGLIDVFLRSSAAQKILFLADRDALVKQALDDGFHTHLPNEPQVRIHTANIDTDKRLFVATQQTMGRCYEKFSPGFFDLIIFDEAHRSIFNRFSQVIEYFDARMVGLTATPAGFIDRNTFQVFECRDQAPTFLYTYEQALAEERLVPFQVYQAQTGFQRDGIKGANLSEEDREALMEEGLDPDAIDYAGTDLEVIVSNKDTLRRQWEEIIEVSIKDRSGSLPGKTIVFAMTKEHAARLQETFEEVFPQHVGQLQLIYDGIERVHDGPWGDGLINKFKKEDKPRLAVSVDMLDTGVDVPEAVNLVFLKPVHSMIKLWQMIGRGTRPQEACRYYDRLPNGVKTEFLIIDFWQNDFGKKSEPRGTAEVPLLVRLFNTRLDILTQTLARRDEFAHQQAIRDCRAMLARVPVESFPIRKLWAEVELAWTDEYWRRVTPDKIAFLKMKVGPLLRYAADVDVPAESFTNKVERLKLQILRGAPTPDLLQSIAEEVSMLPDFVRADPALQESVNLALSADLAVATPPQLTNLIVDLAHHMRNKRTTGGLVRIDLPDFIAGKSYVIIGSSGEPVHVEAYRKRVEERISTIADNHPALVEIRENRQPTEEQLVDLERTLHNELTSPEIQLSERTARQAYGIGLNNHSGFLGFVRHVLDLDAIPDYASVVGRSFENHITSRGYNADQIRFLRSVQEVFVTKRRLTEADLYDPPLTTFGRNAVERFFTPTQIQGIVELAEQLAA